MSGNGTVAPVRSALPPAMGRRLARSSVTAFAIHFGGAGLTYASQLAIARTIGAGGFGIYAYVFAWMTVLAYVAALGFDVSLLRFVPAYRAQAAWGMLRGVLLCAERSAMLVGLGVVVAGVIVLRMLAAGLPDELSRTFLAGLLLVPVWALLWVRSSAVRALGGIVSALAPDRIVRDGLLLGIVGVVSLTPGWTLDAPTAMAATLLSSAAGLGLVSVALHRRKPRALATAKPAYAAAIWSRTALPLMLVGVAEVAMNRTGVVLLGWLGATTDAGIYALAFNVAFLVVLPRTAINALFAPTISDLFVRGERPALQALVTKTALWSFAGAASIAVVLALLAKPLLGWFGRDFGAGVQVLWILLAGQVAAAGAGSQLHLLTMTGHERGAAALMLVSALANAALGAACIAMFGLVGAAMATAITLVLWNAAMALLVWRSVRLVPTVLSAVKFLPGSATVRAGRGPRSWPCL